MGKKKKVEKVEKPVERVRQPITEQQALRCRGYPQDKAAKDNSYVCQAQERGRRVRQQAGSYENRSELSEG